MITQEIIDRGGSKLEITRALVEADFKYVPESTFLYAGQDMGSIEKDIQRMLRNDWKIICRGSHPNDYHGFVDVVPTTKDITSVNQLEKAVKEAEEYMQGDNIRRYSELNDGQPYQPIVHFLIQQQSDSQYVGQALEHPHKNETLVNVLNLDDLYDNLTIMKLYGADPHLIDDDFPEEESLKKLFLEIIPEVKELGILDPNYSQNYEFSVEDTMFFQARPFKRFGECVEFEIDPNRKGCINANSIGITSPEGITLPQISRTTDYRRILGAYNDEAVEHEYALTLDQITGCRKSMPVENIFSKMKVFYTKSDMIFCLGHAAYRFMKKADISIFGGYSRGLEKDEILANDKLTFISDGSRALILPSN
jgi:hypothetical protein